MKINSIRFKVSVLYTSVLGAILLVYSSMLYFNLSYVIYHEMDLNLRKKASAIQETIDSYSRALEPKQEDTPLAIERTVHVYAFEKEGLLQWPRVKKMDQDWKSKMEVLGLDHDYIVIAFPSGDIVQKSNNVSGSCLRMFGKNLKATYGSAVKIRNLVVDDSKLRIITWPLVRSGKVKYVLQLATPIDQVLFILKSKLMVILFTIIMVLALTSALGSLFVIGIFKPISQITNTARAISHKDMSKRVEKKLADEEIEALVDAFNDMIGRLERSFKYIEEFSSNAAHELKTPLAIIRGESEVALRQERSADEYRKTVEACLAEAQRMARIIEDLLLLSKLDYMPGAFQFEIFDLKEFLTEIFEQGQALASGKKIAVSASLPNKPLAIKANKLHLRRLFLNLIDNAIKFTPPQGKIDISVTHADKEVAISISDTGAGIKEQDLSRIFDRFFHLDRACAAETGTGLGLSIVQSIVKTHRGNIEVKSALGKGTTFTVTLPLA